MRDQFMHDLKLSLFFTALIAAFGFCADEAHAQVPVQPQYTRPSKGTATQWYYSAQNAASATTTPLYDWSAFYSLSIFTTFAKANGSACDCPLAAGRVQCTYSFTKFNIKGASEKTSPTFFTVQTSDGGAALVFSNTTTDGFLTGGVNIQATFIKGEFRTGSYVDYAGNPVNTECYMKVVVQPLPYPYRYEVNGVETAFDSNELRTTPAPLIMGGVSWWDEPGFSMNLPLNIDQGSGALAVREHYEPKLSDDSATTVVQFHKACANNNDCSPGGFASQCSGGQCTVTMVAEASGYPQSGVRIQNVGTFPAYCAAGENASQLDPTSGKYSFILKAESVAGDGTGGVLDIPTLHTSVTAKRTVYCTVNAVGTTTIAVLPH